MKTAIKIIILAAVSVALAILVEQAVALAASAFWQKEVIRESFSDFTWFLALAAVIEEISKYWAVFFVIRNNFGLKKINFIFASFFLGTSWGIFEAGLILITNPKACSALQMASPEIIFSLGTIICLHALTALFMGIIIWSGKIEFFFKSLKVLFFPILFHLLFNFLIIQKGIFTNYLVIISLSLFFLINIFILSLNYRKLA